jgi:hypothetical protein
MLPGRKKSTDRDRFREQQEFGYIWSKGAQIEFRKQLRVRQSLNLVLRGNIKLLKVRQNDRI